MDQINKVRKSKMWLGLQDKWSQGYQEGALHLSIPPSISLTTSCSTMTPPHSKHGPNQLQSLLW